MLWTETTDEGWRLKSMISVTYPDIEEKHLHTWDPVQLEHLVGAWASVTCNGADTDHLILRQHHLEILIIRMLCLIFRVHQINNSEISAGCAARPGGGWCAGWTLLGNVRCKKSAIKLPLLRCAGPSCNLVKSSFILIMSAAGQRSTAPTPPWQHITSTAATVIHGSYTEPLPTVNRSSAQMKYKNWQWLL